jgi:methyl-accepting chemotaxis protein
MMQSVAASAAAQSMSGIVDLIDNITGQINPLAQDAAIESARTEEAGRGFTVVAAESENPSYASRDYDG